ncbi:MAG TPA: hypothetical protein PLB97_06810 [Accumulibacter sp.]|nr:hypothetical protein [Accumulibacter sp.]
MPCHVTATSRDGMVSALALGDSNMADVVAAVGLSVYGLRALIFLAIFWSLFNKNFVIYLTGIESLCGFNVRTVVA